MDNILIKYSQDISKLFDSKREDENYFLSLTEDKQLELIQNSNSNNFYDNLKKLKQKE